MNGPQHYAEAERLLDGMADVMEEFKTQLPSLSASGVAQSRGLLDSVVAAAQVHATLALAGATADSSDLVGYGRRS